RRGQAASRGAGGRAGVARGRGVTWGEASMDGRPPTPIRPGRVSRDGPRSAEVPLRPLRAVARRLAVSGGTVGVVPEVRRPGGCAVADRTKRGRVDRDALGDRPGPIAVPKVG